MTTDFWNEVEAQESFEVGTFDVIPDNTTASATIEAAEWQVWDGSDYINIMWSIDRPEAFENQRVFQKIKVLDDDESKALRARRMLAAIDKNAGGKLMALGKQPSDSDLQKCLINKSMNIKIKEWEMNDKKGNWVCAVMPLDLKAAKATLSSPGMEDDIPF